MTTIHGKGSGGGTVKGSGKGHNQSLTISGTPVLTATVGVAYAGFSVAGHFGKTPYVYSVASGSLPPGLTLNASTGLVSGTPTTEGTYSNIILRVTDANLATANLAPFAITVSHVALRIFGTPVLTGTVDEPYSDTSIGASGGQTPYTFAVASGSLPGGLTLNAATGAITGTPTDDGTFADVVIHVTDALSAVATLAAVSFTIFPVLASSTDPVGPTGTFDLVFEDHFDGSTLDTSNWQANWLGSVGAITKPINSAEIAAYDPAQVSVSGGNLRLTTIAAPVVVNGVTYQYRSGMVESAGKREFTYGIFESRVYCPEASAGVIANWPADWLNGHHNSWPDHGETDKMEGLGGTAAWHYHAPGVNVGAHPAGDFTGWHIYTVEWSPGRLDFYYDGVLVASVTSGVLAYPQYLVLNYGMGGYGGPIVVGATMLVDYTRVWKRLS